MSFSRPENEKRALEIFRLLKSAYPDAGPLLAYRNPYELMIGTVLAAQCTDERVNLVTPAFFEKYPAPRDAAQAQQADIEQIIRSTGFFHNKAKNIKALCSVLCARYGEKLPETIDELVALPGIGRKTANVIAGHCFGAPAIVVDTHFIRLSNRLGFTTEKVPEKIERELRALVPEKIQTAFSDVVNWHGRFRCKARKPDCPACEIEHLCPFLEKTGT